MKLNKKLLIILSIIILLLPACKSNNKLEKAIVKILDDRITAIETKDYDLYMSAIGKNNQFLYNEQERWFMNMIDEKISDVSFKVESVDMIDETNGIVTIRQKHKMNNNFDFVYSLDFKYEDEKWMDYGYHFEVHETDKFLVKYTKDETRLEEFTQMLDDSFNNLDKIYELKPLDDYEMKLFSKQEMLRQRSVPANPWLFTGWSEPDESLKIYTGHDIGYDSYANVVQHELVHHITIRICNNNLPLWLLEGIAMYDGSAFYGIDASIILSDISKDNVAFTIDYLENNDLNNDLNKQEIYNFYNTSYMYVRYLAEEYGRDVLMDLFYEAGKKPFHDSTLNYTFEKNNQTTADEVLNTVLGVTKEELSNSYLEWLDNLSNEEIRKIDNRSNSLLENKSKLNASAMIIIGNEFGNTYFDMKSELEALGFSITTVGVGDKELYSSCPNHENQMVTADMDITEITDENINDFSLVFIPAGKHFRTLPYSDDVSRVLNLCKQNQLYISSVCSGNIVLASIDGLIKDIKIASSSVTKDSIKKAEAISTSSTIVTDGYFVTGDVGGGKSGSSYAGAPIKELAETLASLINS